MFFIISHSWSESVTITLLHLRQQEQLSTDSEPQKQGASRVVAKNMTHKVVRVWDEQFFSKPLAEKNFSLSAEADMTTSTQQCKAHLSVTSDEAECLLPSQRQLYSKHQYNTRKVCGKLTWRIFKVYFLIQAYVCFEEQLDNSSEVKTMHLHWCCLWRRNWKRRGFSQWIIVVSKSAKLESSKPGYCRFTITNMTC